MYIIIQEGSNTLRINFIQRREGSKEFCAVNSEPLSRWASGLQHGSERWKVLLLDAGEKGQVACLLPCQRWYWDLCTCPGYSERTRENEATWNKAGSVPHGHLADAGVGVPCGCVCPRGTRQERCLFHSPVCISVLCDASGVVGSSPREQGPDKVEQPVLEEWA